MAEPAGSLVSTLLRRVRDPQGAMHDRVTVARPFLSHAQRLVNAGLRAVIGEAVLVTEPYRLIYPVAALLPNAVHIESVREADRDLADVTWESLWHTDGSWFRRTGDRFEAFARIGRDLLVVYPAKKVASSITVVYTALTANLTQDSIATDLDDTLHAPMLALAESLLYLRARDFAGLDAALATLMRDYQAVAL